MVELITSIITLLIVSICVLVVFSICLGLFLAIIYYFNQLIGNSKVLIDYVLNRRFYKSWKKNNKIIK